MVLLASWTKHGVAPNLQGFLLFVKAGYHVAQAGIHPLRFLRVWDLARQPFPSLEGWRVEQLLERLVVTVLTWRVGGSIFLGLAPGLNFSPTQAFSW